MFKRKFLVTYDLHKPNYEYASLEATLLAFPQSRRVLGSVWILQSGLSAKEINDRLLAAIGPGASVLVVGLTGEASWFGLSLTISEWLRRTLRFRVPRID